MPHTVYVWFMIGASANNVDIVLNTHIVWAIFAI